MLEIPEHLKTNENKKLLNFIQPYSCHGDITEPLERELSEYEGVRSFCPDGKNFKYCFWYLENTIFAFAIGMNNIYLRLPKKYAGQAAENNAEAYLKAGDEWFSFVYNNKSLGSWVKIAYDYAKA